MVGKKISENCEGLPLLILTVADLLSKAEETTYYWNIVAEKKTPLFLNAHDEISKILLPSYKILPQHLKTFFLYMGVFPQCYHINISKFINLCDAEGFLEQNSCQSMEDFVAESLLEISNKSLVMVCQVGSNFRVKTYHLHSVFWHLSVTEALKSTFFQALNTYSDDSFTDIRSQRRLCVRNNILLSIKDVRNLVASVSSLHSLLCTGPPHQYQVPIYFDLRLLKVMDTLTIRLYEFIIDLVRLIHLRYLALTCNGKLPASISKLWRLQYLIVGEHLSITSSKDCLRLPAEIWDMKELRHLQIMRGRLPNPKRGVVLPNLLALLDVSAQSCTKRVLKGIPNVKKLRIRIELAPGSDGNRFQCLNRIYHLHKLESFKCIVVNPEVSSKLAILPTHPKFPSSLKRLSLSGLGYPWECMNMLEKLPNLEVLKLRCFAFRGQNWEIDIDHFEKVKFLSIEELGVKFGFPTYIEHLIFKNCYKLKKLPLNFSAPVKKIEIVDCNPLVVTWAKEMKEIFRGKPFYSKFLEVRSSWDATCLQQ